jgi:hypothetical protein
VSFLTPTTRSALRSLRCPVKCCLLYTRNGVRLSGHRLNFGIISSKLQQTLEDELFRKLDPHNGHRQEARLTFLNRLAECSSILDELCDGPLTEWRVLSEAARTLCLQHGWQVIANSPTWRELDSKVTRTDPALADRQRIHLELIPLRELLNALALKFGLVYEGRPAIWTMETVLETVDQQAKRPDGNEKPQWRHRIDIPQVYAARGIVIEISGKLPKETDKAFKQRFNRACEEERVRYLKALKAERWTSRCPPAELRWIGWLAQWQAGEIASRIDPSVRIPSKRAAFSRGINRAAQSIGITPRISKHNPKRRPGH